jgi:hypothetical protein
MTGVDANQIIKINRQLNGITDPHPHNGGTDCALNFDGSNDYVQVTDHADLRKSSAMSVFAWFSTYVSSSDSGQPRKIVAKLDDANNGYSLAVSAGGELLATVKSGGSDTDRKGDTLTAVQNNVVNGGFTWDGSNLKVYSDATEFTDAGTGVSFPSGSADLFMGRNGASGTGRWNGVIYQVMIYNRVLSGSEVVELFNGEYISNGLKGYWRFDECSGTSAGDSSGNGRTGTISGSPTFETASWSDQRKNVVTPQSLIITADQERFYTYNSTSARTVNASSASSAPYVWQKEFYTQFRVHENHTGNIFAPMPDFTLTGTIRTANGTNISGTFVNDDSQDDHAVTSRYWVSNGTVTMPNDLTWRGIIVNGTSRDYAIAFDGTDDAIIPSTIHNFPGIFTAVYWMNMTDTVNVRTLAGKLSGGTPTAKIAFCNTGSCGAGNDNKIIARMTPGGTSSITNVGYTDGMDRTWVLVIAKRDSANKLSYSINGASFIQNATTHSGTFNLDTIGKSQDASQFFKGQMREIMWYNNTDFSNADAAATYNGSPPSSGLVLHYRFDNPTTSTVILDSSTRKNTGALNNAVGTKIDTGLLTHKGSLYRLDSYDTVTMEASSRHTGSNIEQSHLRAGIDNATAQISSPFYNENNATFSFTGQAASGNHDVKVEFLQRVYSGVNSIKINGTTLPAANYTITEDNSVTPAAYILTINDLHFSTNNIAIFFASATTSPGSSGGGGGGSGGVTVPTPNIGLPGGSTGSSLGLTVTVPTYFVAPGTNRTETITIEWSGKSRMIITEITFTENAHWFTLVDDSLPLVASLQAGTNQTLRKEVRMNVAVPAGEQGFGRSVEMKVTGVASGGVEATAAVHVPITYTSTNIIGILGLIALIGAAGVGLAISMRRRRW